MTTRAAAESARRHMVRAMEAAANSRSNIEREVERGSRAFVPVTIAIALGTVGGGVVLDVPAAIGAASRRGILISDDRVLRDGGAGGSRGAGQDGHGDGRRVPAARSR